MTEHYEVRITEHAEEAMHEIARYHSLSRKAYKQLHTDISLTKGIYYYNRDSEQAKKQAITQAIDF